MSYSFPSEPIIAMSIIPVTTFFCEENVPMTESRCLTRPFGVVYVGSSSLMVRNLSKSRTQLFIISTVCTSTNVLTFRRAIKFAPITVLPKAVAAASIPISYDNNRSAATVCSGYNSPLKETSIVLPFCLLSTISYGISASDKCLFSSSKHPLGRTI